MANDPTPTAAGAPSPDPSTSSPKQPAPGEEAPPATEKPTPWKPPFVKVKVAGYTRQQPAQKPNPVTPGAAASSSSGAGTPSASSAPASSHAPDPKAPAAASGTSTPAGSGSSAAQPTASAEPTKPPLARAYAEMLEKEAKLTQDRQELKPLIEARELLKQGKRLAAMEKLGITIDDAQLELLETMKGSASPEEIARRTTLATIEAQKKADQDALTKADEEAKARAAAEVKTQVTQILTAMDAAVPGLAGKLDAIAAMGATTAHAASWWLSKHGTMPTDPVATLLAFEAFQQEQLESRGFRKSVPVIPGSQSIGDTQQPGSGGTTAAITPADAGEVPLRLKPNGKGLSAIERARLAMQELNIRD